MKRININVAIAGLGNCAGSLVEGLSYYQQNKSTEGLLFPVLADIH
jgi:myo-inositol-1-phosphate synthase